MHWINQTYYINYSTYTITFQCEASPIQVGKKNVWGSWDIGAFTAAEVLEQLHHRQCVRPCSRTALKLSWCKQLVGAYSLFV